MNNHRIYVAITGAQGVGKSTFCRRLLQELVEVGHDVTLIAGLGEKLKAEGYKLGQEADGPAVSAVFLEHLRREREAQGGIVLLDRCLLDALAYKRVLDVVPRPLSEVYEELVRALAVRLKLIVFLEVSSQFAESAATHESPAFRIRIDAEVRRLIDEFGVPSVRLDAASESAAATAATLIVKIALGRE